MDGRGGTYLSGKAAGGGLVHGLLGGAGGGVPESAPSDAEQMGMGAGITLGGGNASIRGL